MRTCDACGKATREITTVENESFIKVKNSRTGYWEATKEVFGCVDLCVQCAKRLQEVKKATKVEAEKIERMMVENRLREEIESLKKGKTA